MGTDIVPVHPQSQAVQDLASICFPNIKIDPLERSLYVGHMFDGVLASVGGLTIYEKIKDCAMLHTGCVHPDFRGMGLQRELITYRVEVAKRYGRSHVFCQADNIISMNNLQICGFVRRNGIPNMEMDITDYFLPDVDEYANYTAVSEGSDG